jgi:hypothetical protein
MNIELLGFDVKRRHEDYAHDWDPARRELYLLRPEVSAPYSVDLAVWPSVFDYAFQGIVAKASKQATLSVPPTQSQTRQLALGLWPSGAEMWSTFSSGKSALMGIPVAVYLLRDEPTSTDELWNSVLGTPPPESACPPDWSHLGYDIADRDLVSGLSNCGYPASEREQLRHRWGSRINDHGLFDDLHDAQLFRGVSDRRVAEHSPFLVYSLYRAPVIWQVPGS